MQYYLEDEELSLGFSYSNVWRIYLSRAFVYCSSGVTHNNLPVSDIPQNAQVFTYEELNDSGPETVKSFIARYL